MSASRPSDTYRVDSDGKLCSGPSARLPNNWGRWGPLDERGTVNLIEPSMVKAAASLISSGRVISCAVSLDFETMPVPPDRTMPVRHFAYAGTDFLVQDASDLPVPAFRGADDYVCMPLQTGTHWDGLAHAHHQATLYNGFWIGNTSAHSGARRCSIDKISPGVVGRGVLLDLPQHAGLERLDPGHVISAEELTAAAEVEQVEIRRGDVLLIRTGHLAWYYSLRDKSEFWSAGAPGIGVEAVEWLHQVDVAALAADTAAVEVVPSETGELYPLHSRLLRDLGLTIGELWWLEELAEACAEDGRYEFFLSAPPMRIQGAVGSPINPVAIK